MDVNTVNRADWERRRKIRLAQVRDQSKIIAKTIRDRIHSASEIQFEHHERTRNKVEHKFKSLALSKLKSDFNYLIQDVGNGYSVASFQPDPNIVLAEKRLINRCKAISRGAEAEKRQKQFQEEQQMDKEMKKRRTHFNKTVEKIRSTLIQSIPSVDSNNHTPSIGKLNECFLIPSQVTLNESNIINCNSNKKTSKPWSMVINSKENQISKFHQTTTCDYDKENEPKVSTFTKLETDVKSYETLVSELNKLSAEEQNIRNKLFTHNSKEVNVPCKNNIPSNNQEKDKHIGMDQIKNILDKNTLAYDIKTRITEKKLNESVSSLNLCMSSSSSTSINYEEPKESIKKTVSFKNKINEKNTVQSSSNLNYNSKFTNEKPLRNINNTLQRIKKKKQLLVTEISANMKPNFNKSNVMYLNSKNVPKRCTADSNLPNESPTNYAKLPNSFYNSKLEGLKKIANKKDINLKCNSSTNVNLMEYINILLKMTPSDVENLSTSSCSSVKLEESIFEHSKTNTQFFSEMLNCISKCLNSDIPDLSQDTMFVNSPKNFNLLNKLKELSNYYLEKTYEIKNICDEDPQILNDKLNELNIEVDTVIQKNNSMNVSSDSSVDGEYVLKHLNTLLRKKGLIKSDQEWPIFETPSDDDTRSLTDQLLDVYPRRSYDS